MHPIFNTDLIFVPVSPTGRVVVFSLTRGSSGEGEEKLSCRLAWTTFLSGASAGPQRGVISTVRQGTRGTDAAATEVASRRPSTGCLFFVAKLSQLFLAGVVCGVSFMTLHGTGPPPPLLWEPSSGGF